MAFCYGWDDWYGDQGTGLTVYTWSFTEGMRLSRKVAALLAFLRLLALFLARKARRPAWARPSPTRTGRWVLKGSLEPRAPPD